MEQSHNKWYKTVFRLRGMPNAIETFNDVANLLAERLGDTPVDGIRVCSLATTLNPREDPPSKVATIMFKAAPSIVQDRVGQNEWTIPAESLQPRDDLVLDIHFMGMTPLNDVEPLNHLHDCIAISGLASHPFGSWQPKDSDKTFMWIRDGLPTDLLGSRAVVYGYDTKLYNSQSFQRISDLADELIEQLQAYGWDSRSAKPVAFLAHSLGGLVLKEALVRLATTTDKAYKNILNVVRGVIFFGVPNLGMEQAHLRTIVQNNPNEALVDDIARNSNYLRRLNDQFSKSPFNGHLRCFWAYETCESPIVVRAADGKISRDGPPAILVSRESATCRFVETDPPVSFPINANHSDMVKFTKRSHYYHIAISKLSRIFSSTQDGNSQTERRPNLVAEEYSRVSTKRDSSDASLLNITTYQTPLRSNLLVEFDAFKRELKLTEHEKDNITSATLELVRDVICRLQAEQEQSEDLRYMRRLEPFLVSMEQFHQIAEALEAFSNAEYMAYIWGSMKYVLQAASIFPEALCSILNAYQAIGEKIPHLQDLHSVFVSSPYLREVLVMIYKDILWFHREAVRQFKQRQWQKLFKASWREFGSTIEHIKQNTERNRRLIENRISITQFEEIRNAQVNAVKAFEQAEAARELYCRAMVMQWLSAFDSATEHYRHRKTRSICNDPGRWLLNDAQFQKWFNPEYCSAPLLWLSGIPGAGKTILASIVVDAAQRIPDTTVAFFYCKHGKETRNSFVSVARSILEQILAQHPHLLPYYYDKASMSSDALLASTAIAKEVVQTALSSCDKTYIIIDGLDECEHEDRKEIASFFQAVVDASPATQRDSIRCLFVSQDDGIARHDFRDLPTIKIANRNNDDLQDFATVWHQKIEKKFGELRSKNCHISSIISARAQGMFIFAELFAKYLEDQISLAALLEELDPAKLPVQLDQVYERILYRILESRGDHTAHHLRKILGWVVCARRPLRWREIQGAVCIDMDNQHVDHDRKISDSPKGLFASLIELQTDDTVELVHSTAREYLVRKNFVDPSEADYSLTMLSLAFLAFPQVDKSRSDSDVRSDLLSGVHSFYDYASACWAMHLQSCVLGLECADKLSQLQETLETFIELHWSPTCKPLPDVKRVQKCLSPMQTSDKYDKITQGVGWARRQSSQHGLGPSQNDALDLWEVTARIRLILESMRDQSTSEANLQRLQHFYGMNWFKCPRVNCHHYHQGFNDANQRKQHVDKHDRPFLCFVAGCQMETFGCATKDELKKHLFQYHGIDEFDEKDNTECPGPSKEKTSNTTSRDACYQCHLCGKRFTRNHNLKSHLRTHEGTKPYECDICGKLFTRKADCDRHKHCHGDKKYTCAGLLKDGSTWGCNSSFSRSDKLADHFRSKAGQKCIRPLLVENIQKDSGSDIMDDSNIFADQDGENADTLLTVGKSLPSFREFLHLCGLDNSLASVNCAATPVSDS